MSGDAKGKAREAVRRAQAKFERAHAKLAKEREAAEEERRRAFAGGQADGLTQRDIAEEVGLHHTRVGQIIRGE